MSSIFQKLAITCAITLLAGCSTPTLRQRCYMALVGYSAVQAGVSTYLDTPYGQHASAEILQGIRTYEPAASQALIGGCGLLVPTGEPRKDVVESELAKAEEAIRRLIEVYTARAAYEEVQ